ncbi:helix-turn-helix transcriptional regulator [uncultured Ramlibacter sp.]|uniref:ArsR/SmtB family transcription factor n=1 Tax=uncultured Ramlibacter sp. TaxID=260755 RepID=UPI0026050CFA|nr:metalloregulator ArsR/SmtB family transcription factor [uncultured Ramlibacter sp.]
MDTLSATFAALADPTRRAILSRLAMGPANVTELALPFTMSQPAISKHLKILERAGLISRSREAQARPCSIQAAPLQEVVEWAGGYRQLWEEGFGRLDSYLQDLQTKEKPDAKRK